MKDEEFILRFKEKFKLEENLAVIFTDASKIENNPSAGIDIVISGKDEAFSLSIDNRCFIFTAELIAVEKALGYILDNGWTNDVLILTDSQAVIKAIGNNAINLKKSRIVCTIRDRIISYVETSKMQTNRYPSIVIGWVPGHMGVVGNEEADGIAKEATKEERELRIKVPVYDWRNLKKEEIRGRRKGEV